MQCELLKGPSLIISSTNNWKKLSPFSTTWNALNAIRPVHLCSELKVFHTFSDHIWLIPQLHFSHITTPCTNYSTVFTSAKQKDLLSHFVLFWFNGNVCEFDTQYYNMKYIHSLLLNCRPWTETIETSTFNFKHETEQGQRQASRT